MSSSRSIAAARNRRASDAPTQPPPQQSRPNTSIGSSAAFSQQTQYGKKVPQQQPQQQQKPTSTVNPNVPFSKITISDAIGLITLRLGKVEQYIIDTQDEEGGGGGGGGGITIPENSKLVDNSVFTSIINRLDSIEKKDIQTKQMLTKIEQDVAVLTSRLNEYIIETNTKLDDIDNAFLIFEQHENGGGENVDAVLVEPPGGNVDPSLETDVANGLVNQFGLVAPEDV